GEDADEAEIAFGGAQYVLIMLVERVDGAGTDRIGAAGRDIHHLAFAGDAVIGLEMVLVVKAGFAAFLHHRVMQRAAHPVIAQDEAAALPAGTADIARAAGNVVESTHDHGVPSSLIPSFVRTKLSCAVIASAAKQSISRRGRL